MKLSELKLNPNNPRFIRDERFSNLVKSIQEMPKMMELRPIIYDPKTMIILGGNMRYRALKELGHKEIPETWIKSADQLNEQERKRFIIADNIQNGEWDFDILANEWDKQELIDWGLNIAFFPNEINEQNEWIGMPEYDEGNRPFQINISFRNEEDREQYSDLSKLKFSKMEPGSITWSAWWPDKERNDLSSIKIEV